MKYIIKLFNRYFLAVLVCCITASCKKLLEIPPNPSDKISTEQAFADSSNVTSVLAGIYSNFAVVDQSYGSFHNGGITVYTGLSADELINLEISSQADQTPLYVNSVLPDNNNILTLWADAYGPLYNINAAIAGIAASNGLSADLKQRFIGEVKTVRALYYFNLLNLFGAVPLVTGIDFKVNASLPRSPVEKVYAQIVADLEQAIQVLMPQYPSANRARPNLYTAKALLAKVYLYLKNWQKAATLSGEVIDAGLYSLEPDLNNVFLTGSTEAIWQLPALGQFLQTTEGYLFGVEPDVIPKFELTPALYNAFEVDDQRKVNWIAETEVNSIVYYYPYKYKNYYATSSATIEDYMILRLGEQYLIRAEARAQLDQLSDALDDLNLVRQRAGLADLSFTDKQTLLADIMQERRIELFAEWGNRWYDLKRTNTADAVLGASKPSWQPHDALYPIPKTQRETNPFLTQNPGY
jgi:hypothetical protein